MNNVTNMSKPPVCYKAQLHAWLEKPVHAYFSASDFYP